MAATVNFTPEQEAEIRASAPLNLEKATVLAAKFGKASYKSIVAKAVRMNVRYERKAPTTKTGEPVIRKEELVDSIGKYVSGDLDGLEKASKPALQAILAALTVRAE
jgi:hypothetical protein